MYEDFRPITGKSCLRIAGGDGGSRQGRATDGFYYPGTEELELKAPKWFDCIPGNIGDGIMFVPEHVWAGFMLSVAEQAKEADVLAVTGARGSTLHLPEGQLIGPLPLNGHGVSVRHEVSSVWGKKPTANDEQSSAFKLVALQNGYIRGLQISENTIVGSRIGAMLAGLAGSEIGIPRCDYAGFSGNDTLGSEETQSIINMFGLTRKQFNLWPTRFLMDGRECVAEGDNAADLQHIRIQSERGNLGRRFISAEGGTWLKAAANYFGKLDREGLTTWKSPIGALINDLNLPLLEPFYNPEGKHPVHGKYENISTTIERVISGRLDELVNSKLVYIPEPPLGYWAQEVGKDQYQRLNLENLPIDQPSRELIVAINNICVAFQLRKFIEESGADVSGVDLIMYSGNLRLPQRGCHMAFCGAMPPGMNPKVMDLQDSVTSTIIAHLESTGRRIRNLKDFAPIFDVDFKSGAFEQLYQTWLRAMEHFKKVRAAAV